jgi:hypothetical protein
MPLMGSKVARSIFLRVCGWKVRERSFRSKLKYHKIFIFEIVYEKLLLTSVERENIFFLEKRKEGKVTMRTVEDECD